MIGAASLRGTRCCRLRWQRPAGAHSRGWPSERPPRPLDPQPVSFPPYELRTLRQRPAASSSCGRTSSRSSACACWCAPARRRIPPARPGVAAMVATLLDQGTTTAKRQSRSPTPSTTWAAGSAPAPAPTSRTPTPSCCRASFDEGLQLLADVVRRPAFTTEELERQREQVLSALKVSYQDPDYVAGAVVERLIFGFHPVRAARQRDARVDRRASRATISSRSTSAGITPNNTLLAIVGDVDVETAVGGGPEGLRRLAARRRCRPSPRRTRPSRRGASWSSIGRAPCRPRSASGSSRSGATTTTTCR